MSIDIEISNRALVPVCNELIALSLWLRPGELSFTVGCIVEVVKPIATLVVDNRNAMFEEAVQKYSVTLPGGAPHPRAGHVITEFKNGKEIPVYVTPEAGAEFERRERALMDTIVTITIDRKLTMTDIKSLGTERLAKPRGESTGDFAVEFATLMPLIERTNGVTLTLTKGD